MNSLEKACDLIYGDRQDAYGHPKDNIGDIARVWSVILGHDVTPRQVIKCMVGLKLCRDKTKEKEDNIVDAIGYLALIDRLGE